MLFKINLESDQMCERRRENEKYTQNFCQRHANKVSFQCGRVNIGDAEHKIRTSCHDLNSFFAKHQEGMEIMNERQKTQINLPNGILNYFVQVSFFDRCSYYAFNWYIIQCANSLMIHPKPITLSKTVMLITTGSAHQSQ